MTWYALSSSNSARQTWRSGLMTTATDGSRSVRIWRRTRHRWRQGTTTSWREVRGGRCGGGACIVHMATCSWESSDCEKVVGHLVITVDCTSSWSGSGRTPPLTRSVIDLLFLLPWVESVMRRKIFSCYFPHLKVKLRLSLYCFWRFAEKSLCSMKLTFVSKVSSEPNFLNLYQNFIVNQTFCVCIKYFIVNKI